MPQDTRVFLDAVVNYLPFLYVFEIVIGILLVFDKWSSLLLIMLFPLSVSFAIFIIANKNLEMGWQALIVILLNVILLIDRRAVYKPMLNS